MKKEELIKLVTAGGLRVEGNETIPELVEALGYLVARRNG